MKFYKVILAEQMLSQRMDLLNCFCSLKESFAIEKGFIHKIEYWQCFLAIIWLFQRALKKANNIIIYIPSSQI